MSLLALLNVLLAAANALFKYLNDKNMISAGEDRQIAKQLLVMAQRSRTIKELDEKFEKITDKEVLDALDGDFRD